MWSKRRGQPPIRNTFKSKNTYENILTGINKEGTEWSVMPITRLYLWVRWLSWTLDSQIREHIAEGIDNLH
jgi:hypothetical protein